MSTQPAYSPATHISESATPPVHRNGWLARSIRVACGVCTAPIVNGAAMVLLFAKGIVLGKYELPKGIVHLSGTMLTTYISASNATEIVTLLFGFVLQPRGV